MNRTPENDLLTIEEVAEILGVKRSQARALVGEPDKAWTTAAGRTQYVYDAKRVLYIKARRAEIKKKRAEQKGYRSCYYCHDKFIKKDLCDGLCVNCSAQKVVKNFVYRGDWFSPTMDMKRLLVLANAVKNFLPDAEDI